MGKGIDKRERKKQMREQRWRCTERKTDRETNVGGITQACLVSCQCVLSPASVVLGVLPGQVVP